MLPGPSDIARDLLVAAALCAAAGRPADHLVEIAAELLALPKEREPLHQDGLELPQDRGRPV